MKFVWTLNPVSPPVILFSLQAITFKVDQSVEVGKQVEFLKTGLTSKVISEIEVRGRDGLPVEVKEIVEAKSGGTILPIVLLL